MSPISKAWYSNNINNLLVDNTDNLILVGINHIIVGVLLMVIFLLLFNYQYIMPEVWRPPITMRTSFTDGGV